MDLKLATTADIVNELLGRELRFVLIAVEHTNSRRTDAAYLAGQGASVQDVLSLIQIGHDAFDQIEQDGSDGNNAGDSFA